MASIKSKKTPGKNDLSVNKRKSQKMKTHAASQVKKRPSGTQEAKGKRKPVKPKHGKKTNTGNPSRRQKTNAMVTKHGKKTNTGNPNNKQKSNARRGKKTKAGKPKPSLKTGRNKLGKTNTRKLESGERGKSTNHRPGGISSLNRKKWNRNVDKNWKVNSVNAMPLKYTPKVKRNWDRELVGIKGTNKRRDLKDYRKIYSSASSTWNNKIYRKRFRRRKIDEGPREIVSDVTKLVNLDVVNQAIGGIRTLATKAKENKTKKNLLEDTGEQDAMIYLQVTLCKLPQFSQQLRLANPLTISVNLPHSVNGDEAEVILITRDLEKGIKVDHEDSLNHYLSLLQKHQANTLVNEVLPLRQLKVEFKEFEAKRLLSNRVDVILCDDSVMRFVPKFLGKHFYKRKRTPVQVNLKADDLKKEITRALSVSQIKFTFRGNCAQMKVGRLSQTDEQIADNVKAAAVKLANRIPGGWKNVQNIGLKLGKSASIPFFARINSVKNVTFLPPKTVNIVKRTVSGIISTRPKKVVTVYPDGSVGVLGISKRTLKRIPPDEKAPNKEESIVSGGNDDDEANEAVRGLGKRKMIEEIEEEEEEEEPKKRGGKKMKKKNDNLEDDLESDEDGLEERELAYLRKRSSGRDAETTSLNQPDDDDELDVWNEISDDESDLSFDDMF
ncbi:ribosomal L1 domain-containing protein 1-like isoform X2 [Homarus americanus]|uniref:ribosomal L1 domain-containing protein 1-like isoform X2 n=1 Tax=Homarus americanus TaxID=6706 RepID=UPI001C44F091|nr:ribosomal L1 domain-containing protein 1-like isoform X2 [Homarus americanus]